MLGWAFVFLLFALVAAALGFAGIARISATIGWVVFLVLVAATLVANLITGRRTSLP